MSTPQRKSFQKHKFSYYIHTKRIRKPRTEIATKFMNNG